MQYQKPEQVGYYVGEPVPFWHDGVFHLFYLLDREHHAGNNGLGGHEWAHASSRDLVEWEQHPIAVELGKPGEHDAATIGGGSVIEHEGTFYAFYGTRTPQVTGDRVSQHVCLATSTNGVHFTKHPGNPVLSAPEGYSHANFRDPCVFRDDLGVFHLLVTGELTGERPPVQRGCLANFTSLDLRSWRREEALLIPGYAGLPQSPGYFHWNGYYYLTLTVNWQLHYRVSRHALGPWRCPPVDTLDGRGLAGLKVAGFGERRLAVGFLRWRDQKRDHGAYLYGGNAVFRELVQGDDGTLWTQFPAAMVPAAGEPLPFSVTALAGDVDVVGREHLHVRAGDGMGLVRFTRRVREGRISCVIEPRRNAGAYGFFLRAAGLMEQGYEVRFMPHERLVWVRNLQRQMTLSDNRYDTALYGVTDLDKPVTVELLLTNDIIDLCVNRRRCLISRYPDWYGDELYLFCERGEACFDGLQIRAWT
jgi:beta-fructofuranosidase